MPGARHHPCTDPPTAGGVAAGTQSSVHPRTLEWDQPRSSCPLTDLACTGSLSSSQDENKKGNGETNIEHMYVEFCSYLDFSIQ